MKPKKNLGLLEQTSALLKTAQENLVQLASVQWPSGHLAQEFAKVVNQKNLVQASLYQAREKLLTQLIEIAIVINEVGEEKSKCGGIYHKPCFKILSQTQISVRLDMMQSDSILTPAEVCRYEGVLFYCQDLGGVGMDWQYNNTHTLFGDICNQLIQRIEVFLNQVDKQDEQIKNFLNSTERLDELRQNLSPRAATA